MRILYFTYIFSICSAAIIDERKQALGGSFHCSIGYDIFPSLLRRLISTQTEQKNDTADISADRIIAQSCPNPYCVCISPLATPVVESFPYDYTTTITSAVFVYATSTGAAGPCPYTEDPGTGSWIYLASKMESTCGPPSIMPPQGGAPPPNINNDIDSIIDDYINPITNDHNNDAATNVPDYVRNLESISFYSDES